jgi:HEPN domain-containing protein
MNPLVEEWVLKATADLQTAKREARVQRNPDFDAVCFHSQQGVEKMLKAKLALMRREIPRTHDLTQLLDALLDVEPLWEAWRGALDELVSYAVEFRYPGEMATRGMAKQALKSAIVICKEIKMSLDSPK